MIHRKKMQKIAYKNVSTCRTWLSKVDGKSSRPSIKSLGVVIVLKNQFRVGAAKYFSAWD